jgi:RND family efflux transporter MFP subunit
MNKQSRAQYIADLKRVEEASSESSGNNSKVKTTVFVFLLLGVGAVSGIVAQDALNENILVPDAVTSKSDELTAEILTVAVSQSKATPIPEKPVQSSDKSHALEKLNATGYVIARRKATVSSRVLGRIEELYVEEGSKVSKDQKLAQLDNQIETYQLGLAEARLASASASANQVKAQFKDAEVKYLRGVDLAKSEFISSDELETLESAMNIQKASYEAALQQVNVEKHEVAIQKQLLENLVIYAPFDGTIISKNANEGEIVSPSSAGGGFTRTGIYTLVDMDSLEVEIEVSESYISRVASGAIASISLNAVPEVEFPAEVIAIIPTADRRNETIKVRLSLLQRDNRILPDMAVRVKLNEGDESFASVNF